MAGKKGQKKRFWSDEEKRSICQQAKVPGVSVAQVARRYAMNANLIHKWLREPRFMSDQPVPDGLEDCAAATFVPVEIEGSVTTPHEPSLPSRLDRPLLAERVDITLSDGRRVLIEGPTSLLAVVGLVEGLT